MNPAGGLARRAWVVNQIKSRFAEAAVLLADTGNFSDTPTPQGDVKTSALLEGMERLGYQVVNVGERDIRLGYDEFAQRAGRSTLQFVSANIVRKDTQQPVFAPHAVVELPTAGGARKLRVGVIGVVRYNPMFVKSGPDQSSMEIVHPVERVKKELEALRAKNVDLVVLLAALHMDDARRIAEQAPGIDFVLGAYNGVFSPAAEKQGQTSIAYCGNKGQRLGETRVFLGPDNKILSERSQMHLLTAVYPADKSMLDFVNSVPVKDTPIVPASPPGVGPETTGSHASPPGGK